MILKRLGQGLLVLLVLETVTFFLIRLLPGHPFMGKRNFRSMFSSSSRPVTGWTSPPWSNTGVTGGTCWFMATWDRLW